MARRPITMFRPGIVKPRSDKPKRRKNRIVHQAAREFGVLILFSSKETSARLREPAA
jgi:hypothetical protein